MGRLAKEGHGCGVASTQRTLLVEASLGPIKGLKFRVLENGVYQTMVSFIYLKFLSFAAKGIAWGFRGSGVWVSGYFSEILQVRRTL